MTTDKPKTKKQQAADEKTEAIARLRDLLKPGDTVYTVLRHVSTSGMSRVIDLYVMEDNAPRWISGLMARACGLSLDSKRQGVRVGGCGMDMGFHLVYELAATLFPRGSFQCIGERCPSNDHSNGDRDRKPHVHSDGGYALRHSWM